MKPRRDAAERRAGRRRARDQPGRPERVGRLRLLARRARRSAPTASSIFGAAGSERGNRGFVMAYTTDLKPAWPTPFWTIPPDLQSWRRASRIVGGGPVWTPVTVDATTNTVYFGTGSGTPVLLPGACAPGNNPRTGSLIAVDLATGKLKWWQQLIERDQWEYDVAQPPLVYNGAVGGADAARRLRRDEGGPLVRVRRPHGATVPRAGQGARPRRASAAEAGPAGRRSSRARSVGSTTRRPPTTRRRTTSSTPPRRRPAVLIQDKLTPTQKKRKFLLGDIFLGLENGNFGAVPPELEGPRLDQRDRRLDRTPGLEVRHARARARRRQR